MDKQQELQYKLAKLQMEHREMEQAIDREFQSSSPDQILIQRYKKRKLQIKDLIAKTESELLPDIIAWAKRDLSIEDLIFSEKNSTHI